MRLKNLQFRPYRADSSLGQQYPGGGVITSLFEE